MESIIWLCNENGALGNVSLWQVCFLSGVYLCGNVMVVCIVLIVFLWRAVLPFVPARECIPRGHRTTSPFGFFQVAFSLRAYRVCIPVKASGTVALRSLQLSFVLFVFVLVFVFVLFHCDCQAVDWGA